MDIAIANRKSATGRANRLIDVPVSRVVAAARSTETSPTPVFRPALLYALALGTFAVGTEGFMIAAILPTVARSLLVSVQAAGQLVTIFALVYAISSPVLTALTAAVSRRHLLMLSLGGFVAANLVAAAAQGFWSLAAARVLLALAAGLYVPNANALASALAPSAYRGRALAIVNGGLTVAVAVGVPLGAVVGAHLGWRATFVGVAILSAAALAVLALRLPYDVVGSPPANLRARLAVVGVPGVLPTLFTTLLWALGSYEVYTYVAPFLTNATGMRGAQIGSVLTLLGGSALAGVVLGGVASDRFGPRMVQAVTLPLMAVAFAGLTLVSLFDAPQALGYVVPLVALWGATAWGFYPPHQSRLISIAGLTNTPVILSLNASFMYVGFSSGAALGSLVILFASVAWIGAVGAMCIAAAMVVSHYAWTRHAPLA